MECVEIHGGKPLQGSVDIQGSKNAVLPILAGCILHEGISRIRHCPRIRDVFDTIVLLEQLGCHVWWEEHCLAVDASDISDWQVPAIIAGRMRSSILFLGALLGRTGKARLCYPGGCVLGERPVDLHLEAMRQLGAIIQEENGCILATGEALRGKEIALRFPSVGATENIILASVLAEGTTVIHNAAKEPEIGELCLFLREKGADIREFSEGRIEITGCTSLTDSEHDLVADRIVAGTYMMAAVLTGGCVTLRHVPRYHLEAVFDILRRMGIAMEQTEGNVIVDGSGLREGIDFLETTPYPGFPTDLQSPMMTVFAVTKGTSRIRENIFASRFKIVQQLNRMGADIELSGRDAVIRGVPGLRGTEVEAEELRGAAALFLAGLCAQGKTTIRGYEFINRGYEDICENLSRLGAEISIRRG